MALSNTAVPKYYGMFRDAVIRREISVCETVSLEMNRIDQLIDNPRYWYDDRAIEGFIHYYSQSIRFGSQIMRAAQISLALSSSLQAPVE